MTEDDAIHLEHMRESLGRIAQYTREGREHFRRDPMVQDAVIRNLQTLAESTQRLSSGLKLQYPEVPWRSIAEFRNALVHDYLSLDLDILWGIVEHDLTMLRAVADVEWA